MCEAVRQMHGQPDFCVFRARIRLRTSSVRNMLRLRKGYKHVIITFIDITAG